MSFAARIAAVLVASLVPTLAAAQPAGLFRAYLSLSGSDANPCTLAQPCRLLPAAVAAVRSGGEIWMLDSANYNTARVTISKPMTILAVPGELGSVVGVGPGAISVALPAGETVTLRNLDILPLNVEENDAGIGIEVTGGGVLMQDCNVRGFRTGMGLRVSGSGTGAVVTGSTFFDHGIAIGGYNGASLSISDSRVVKNTTSGIALEVLSGLHSATLSVTRTLVRTSNVGIGATNFIVGSSVRLFVSESRVESNGTYGVLVNAALGATLVATVQNTMLTGSATGIFATGSGSSMLVAGSTLASNDTHFAQSGAANFATAGNNALRFGTISSGSITTSSLF